MKAGPEVEDLLRELAPQVLSVLIRRHGQFDACEDAVQEALLAASMQWPADGLPANPRGWMITVASRRLLDHMRNEQARRRREATAAALAPPDEYVGGGPGDEVHADRDDTLALLFLCCHPALTPASQVALSLRAVGGLTTGQIAHAFLVPEATMAARISRAKRRIKDAGARFQMPSQDDWPDRLAVVLQVLYLIFNEGCTATSGPDLQRPELAHEAIRLTREVRRMLPDDGEVAGLLALMLLTDARSNARTGRNGSLIPLAEQDRSLWDTGLIKEGAALVADAMARSPLGPYQLQAAIAACHLEAPRAEDTDWYEISVLYRILERIAPNPMVTLNRAVAVAKTKGPHAGLDLLRPLEADDRVSGHHRYYTVRAHLLEMAGDQTGARADYQVAAQRTLSLPEQRFLRARAARLAEDRTASVSADDSASS